MLDSDQDLRALVAAGRGADAVRQYRSRHQCGEAEARAALGLDAPAPQAPQPAYVAPAPRAPVGYGATPSPLFASSYAAPSQPAPQPALSYGAGPSAAEHLWQRLETDAEVLRELQANNKIGAIKRVRELMGWGLAESKNAVEERIARGRWREGVPAASPVLFTAPTGFVAGVLPAQPQGGLTPEVLEELRALLRKGQKIEAIKRHREATGSSLLDAKNFVEALA